MKDTTLYYIAILVALVIFYKWFCTCSEGFAPMATVSVDTIMKTARVWHQGGRIRARDGKMYSFSDVERIMNSFRWQQGILWKASKRVGKRDQVLTRSQLNLIASSPAPTHQQLDMMNPDLRNAYYLLSEIVDTFLGTSKLSMQVFNYLTTGKGEIELPR